MTYEKALKLAIKHANEKNKEIEACKLLLLELSGLSSSAFFLNIKHEMDENLESLFFEKLNQYIEYDIPVQHLIGYAYFFGRKIIVSEHVLIPRPETEMLVELVLYEYDSFFENKDVKVLDLGTGSGCIGLTLSLEEPKMDVTISDISDDALKVAQNNKINLESKARIIQSDLFDSIEEKFDIIVSNPPYIPQHEKVDLIVQKEPKIALYGGLEGVSFYESILKASLSYLNPKGLIAFEHGYNQKNMIQEIAKRYYPNSKITTMKDLAGKDRFTFIYREET
jgi:release factor glutamine methyltransferase